jgi:hypothetical protein
MKLTLLEIARRHGAEVIIDEQFLDGSAHVVISWNNKDSTLLNAMLLKNGMNWYYGDHQCGTFDNAVLYAMTTRNKIHEIFEGSGESDNKT